MHGLTPADHLNRCRELSGQGYRPTAISVLDLGAGKGLATASVWYRPAVSDGEKDVLAKRQARAAITLLQLGHPQQVWPRLRHSPDPRLATFLIHDLSPMGAEPATLLQRLDEPLEASEKAALLLCLGEFTNAQLPSTTRQPLTEKLLQMYRQEADPGVHSAVDWLLRKWKQADRLEKTDHDLATPDPLPARGWYVNGQGQTFAVIRDPPVFRMGSPGTEVDRYKQEETAHLERIPRSFAIATKKVTVDQFRRFRGSHSYPIGYSPDLQCPVITVSWFDAVRYCQWLDEQEGVPESEWCYPKGADVKEGMRLPAEYLSRTGYRLPTEAEWEYACRAGATTSRCYGSSKEMLGDYAWYYDNAQDQDPVLDVRSWPVGEKHPNALGLFDMHGNVWEWCQSRYLPYAELPWGEAVEDAGEPPPVVVDDSNRVVRGGSFLNRAPIVRSAARNKYEPKRSSYYYVGFRVARTCR